MYNATADASYEVKDDAVYGYCKFCEEVSFEARISQPRIIAMTGDETIDLCRDNAESLLCSCCVN